MNDLALFFLMHHQPLAPWPVIASEVKYKSTVLKALSITQHKRGIKEGNTLPFINKSPITGNAFDVRSQILH